MGDIYNHLMQGLQFAADGAASRKQSRLASLYSQAIGAAPEDRQGYIGQMAALDPNSANQASAGLYKMDDSAKAALAQEAAVFMALPPEQKPLAYPRLAQLAHAQRIQVPMEYHPGMDENIGKIAQALGGAGPGGNVQSTYIDAMGNRVAIMRDGTTAILGQNAPNNQIIDTGNGFYGVNKGNLNAAPVMVGGQPQQAPQAPSGQVQSGNGQSVYIDPALPPNMRAAIAADESQFAQMPGGGEAPPMQGAPVVEAAPQPMQGGQLRSAPKPAAAPTQLQLNADARDQARLELAQQAAARAASPKAADNVKAEKIAAARADALDSVNQAIDGIDRLTKSSGFDWLGTYRGDIAGMIPHTGTRDATNALETIKNQVLLATLSKLKALSATGASGFGALSNQEGRILQNSIANLETAQSHDAIVQNLKTIRETLQRAAGKIGGQNAPAQTGGVDDLLSKYGVK